MELPLREEALKQIIKAAFLELLSEKRELMQEIIIEALEDYALGAAIKEGIKNDLVSRDEILNVLEN